MFPVTITDFAEWLEKELIEQKVTQAELSRRSGISPSQISKILNMQSSPGPEACPAIARAALIKLLGPSTPNGGSPPCVAMCRSKSALTARTASTPYSLAASISSRADAIQ